MDRPRADDVRAAVERNGYAIVEDVLSPEHIRTLATALETSDSLARIRTRAGITFGSRNALEVSEVRKLAQSREVRALVDPVIGPAAFPVRGLLFDKVAGANWRVPWHQDPAIAVRERREVPGFTGWSIKAGVPHVHPPACILETMLAVRLQLDDVDEGSGPLRVLPGSHGRGKLDRAEIGRFVEAGAPVSCTVASGGAVLMRPLLLHASSPATWPARRRVLHLEFAQHGLPGGLEWFDSPAPTELERQQNDAFRALSLESRLYWPFPVTPTTGTSRPQIDFLETAFAEGFTPYMFPSENFEAGNDRLRRTAWLIHRGNSKRWEVGLVERGEHVRGFILEGFDRCAQAALRWLRGEDAAAIVETSGPISRKTWSVGGTSKP